MVYDEEMNQSYKSQQRVLNKIRRWWNSSNRKIKIDYQKHIIKKLLLDDEIIEELAIKLNYKIKRLGINSQNIRNLSENFGKSICKVCGINNQRGNGEGCEWPTCERNKKR